MLSLLSQPQLLSQSWSWFKDCCSKYTYYMVQEVRTSTSYMSIYDYEEHAVWCEKNNR